MKGPFPGMDPYLEAHWGGINTSLMAYASTQLNSLLPGDLLARVEEYLTVPRGEEGTCQVTTADEKQTQRYLKIFDASDGERVVTGIEILSPGNKLSADGQVAYLRKQREYIEAGVNLVEIDLIRAGSFVLAVPKERLPKSCRTTYLVCTRRTTRPGVAEVFPIPLRDPLPNLPVPLRPTDKDVVLQLQPLLDACYRDGRYDRLNYRVDPTPPLDESDARWAEELLREKGLR